MSQEIPEDRYGVAAGHAVTASAGMTGPAHPPG
jgi:hypothetical protein